MFQHRQLKHALSNPADMMEIHRRSHKCAGNEQRFGCIHTILIKDRPLAGMDQMPDEALSIDGTVGCTRIVGIPKKVIHTVYIKISVNYTRQWMISLYDSAEFGRINSPFTQPVTCLFLDNRFNIIVGPMQGTSL